MIPGFVRGTSEPCLYYQKEWDAAVTPHIKDGRATGPKEVLEKVKAHLAQHLLLKSSELVWPGSKFGHLGKMKCRDKMGWTTLPNPRHAEQVIELSGVSERGQGKTPVTPGTKLRLRSSRTMRPPGTSPRWGL